MSDEEIRMRCLELATGLKGREMFEYAETLYKWVIKIREIGFTRELIKQNTVTFEIINPERKD